MKRRCLALAVLAAVSPYAWAQTQVIVLFPAGAGELPTSLVGTVVTSPQVSSLGSVVLHGAHSRPLERRAAPGKSCVWTAGDAGRDDHGERRGKFAVGEIGACRRFSENVQGGISLGKASSKHDFVLNGTSDVHTTFGVFELVGNVRDTRLWPSVALFHQYGDANVRRRYFNVDTGMQDSSAGRPDVRTTGLRLRVDWEDAARILGAALSPYADASYSRTRIDAYTESEGGFPARFEQRREKSREARLGLAASYAWTSTTNLLSQVEYAHRFEKSGASTSGAVPGRFSFEMSGQEHKRNWVRAGLGLATTLGPGTASAMANATTEGAVPSYWLNLSYQIPL
jgi:uncharacterized protein YhjY with autotransporter beta-barrel domain